MTSTQQLLSVTRVNQVFPSLQTTTAGATVKAVATVKVRQGKGVRVVTLGNNTSSGEAEWEVSTGKGLGTGYSR